MEPLPFDVTTLGLRSKHTCIMLYCLSPGLSRCVCVCVLALVLPGHLSYFKVLYSAALFLIPLSLCCFGLSVTRLLFISVGMCERQKEAVWV